MVKESLIIFAKNPVAGNVKTRLAATIGDKEALSVYEWLLDCTFHATENLNCRKSVYFDTMPSKNNVHSLAPYPSLLQQGENLGEKMKNAFLHEFEHADKVVIIGSDCADLEEKHITASFKILSSHDAVIGPAVDGGYYLLGLSSFIPSLFENIAWSTKQVLTQTQHKLDHAGLSWTMLEKLTDIDTVEDLRTRSENNHVE